MTEGKEEKDGESRQMSKETQGHGPSTQKKRAYTDTEICECMNILTNNKQQTIINNGARGRLQPNRPANRCRCMFVNEHKRGRSEVLPEAHGHSSEQREPP